MQSFDRGYVMVRRVRFGGRAEAVRGEEGFGSFPWSGEGEVAAGEEDYVVEEAEVEGVGWEGEGEDDTASRAIFDVFLKELEEGEGEVRVL